MKRIKNLEDSPCYKCKCSKECDKRIKRNLKLSDIRDGIYGNADFDFHNCGIWIALNAPEMVEIEPKYCADKMECILSNQQNEIIGIVYANSPKLL